MPMLHSCGFPSCETFTLSTYCFEHEVLIRAEIESERKPVAISDEPTARELAHATPPAPARPGLASA
jgi:hypothetical protein